MLRNVEKIPISGATALVVGAVAAVGGGLVGAASTQADGTRNVRRKYDGEYQLRPTSKDAAKSSINTQRMLGGGAAVIGAGTLGFQLFSSSGAGLAGTLLGGALLGIGIGKIFKLSGAEDRIDASLPEHTPAGQSDMTRHNKYSYQNEGAGYNAHGVYQGARWGQAAFSSTYQQSTLDKMMPTVPNALHMSTYLGGNVTPGGPFGMGVPTGIPDANARGIDAAARFAADQQLLAQLHQQPAPTG